MNSPDCLRVLTGLADILAPLVKDLVRWSVATRPTHEVASYLAISNAPKFKAATERWQASQLSG